MAMLRRIYYVCSYTFNIPFSEMMNPEFLIAWVGQWDYSQYRWAPLCAGITVQSGSCVNSFLWNFVTQLTLSSNNKQALSAYKVSRAEVKLNCK